VFDDPWLDEGLATYSSSLYYEFGRSPEFARNLVGYWQQRLERLKMEGKDDQIARDLAYFESLNNPGIYGGVVYVKAALFFHALRQEIGDQAFFEALQQYYQAEKYDNARPADLLAAFEQATGRELDAFYAGWLNAP
jgi:aminopeptidase N